MIVILHSPALVTAAETAKADLLAAYKDHVDVALISADSGGGWPASPNWDDLLILLYDGSTFPSEGQKFVESFQAARGAETWILPVAIDPTARKPPPPRAGIKALFYDATAAGPAGRLVNRVGAMLGLKIQTRRTDLFISYRAVDGKQIAEQLYDHLKSLGLRCFLDEATELDGYSMILPGSPVQQEIDQRLETASMILLIDTPKAPESPWIKHEIDTADGLLVPIMPICLRVAGDSRPGTRFRELMPLQRWKVMELPVPGNAPLNSGQLDEIVQAAEKYMCEIFQRKCRVPFLVQKEFVSKGFGWATLDQRLLMFQSSKTGGRLTTKILNHCSIFDEIYVPALKRFYEYMRSSGHFNHSLFIYEGEMLSKVEMESLATNVPDPVVVLHHQELAALIDSNFTKLGKS
jgi:hypothetical protein